MEKCLKVIELFQELLIAVQNLSEIEYKTLIAGIDSALLADELEELEKLKKESEKTNERFANIQQ